uniref:Chromo domain-containing protein n=1 Tax=Glossina pallidipes TaxID=7398 RepID=A0A1A9ZTT7_GLOPL
MQTGTETECTNESLLNQKFAKGEKVFCFNGPFFYEAKILQCELTDDKNFEYYVHYIGWNNYSDEWVPEDRILKYNENNASKEKKRCGAISEESKHETSDDRNAEKRDCSHKEAAIHCSSVESPASAPPRTDDASSELMTSMKADQFGSKKENSPRKGVERVGGFAFNLEENFSNNVTIQTLGSSAEDLEMWFLTKMEIKIKMPNELKERLADDWEAINEQSKLLNIPSRITAQDVVDQYIASKSSRKSVRPSTDTIIAEVMSGIIEYFNVMLGTRILYNFEKQQYRGILQKYPNTPLSQLYGATHLLRLLANLDSVLTLSALDKQHIKTILRYLHDFLKFLVRNTSIYFSMSNFIKASPQHFHVDQEK